MKIVRIILAVFLFFSGCFLQEESVNSVISASSEYTLLDVHGAGAQRSDPKSGDPADFPVGMGPQGDVLRIYNFAILVRGNSSLSDDYPVIDTGQVSCFDNEKEISSPSSGYDFYGQDAQYNGLQPSYTDNGNGTVTDNNTGLMWQKDYGDKKTYNDAMAGAASCNTGGYTDWRLPTIKELYSLIEFTGTDPDPLSTDTSSLIPFIDPVFPFEYGTATGERIIDVQYISSTKYVSTTMGGNETAFGVNFADGRIKGYPVDSINGAAKNFYVKYVRGNPLYGKNSFTDNGNGTVSDCGTGLMWMKNDSGYFNTGDSSDGKVNWKQALKFAEYANSINYAGYSDWRLPNAKELQSIVDYTRSPDTTGSPAIDPVFSLSEITDEEGGEDYGYYWTGTTHISTTDKGDTFAVYIAFGRAVGYMKL